MCGIFGIIKKDASIIEEHAIRGMQEALKHRGPDQSGHYSEPGLAMGANRLSIVDLRSGDQPIFNEDKSLVIVYNGEIYNHLEIRKKLLQAGHIFKTNSDTETVLHAFEEYREECLKYFNGMFAFAIWDKRTKNMFIARDRLGIKPLYIASIDKGLAFASEGKALLDILPGARQPDWQAIYRYFSFGYIPSPESPFRGIQKLPAGCYGWIRAAQLETKSYWSPEYGMGANAINIEDAGDKVLELLGDAVKLELMSDVPLGVFLSGGLDSSAIALFCKKYSKGEINSFTLRFEETTHDESEHAALVARKLGLRHHEFIFSRDLRRKTLSKIGCLLDEPFGDLTVLPLLALSELTRDYVKVVLTGWGGDEIFAGYPTYKAHQLAQLYRKLPAVLSRGLIPALVNSLPVSDKYMSFEFKSKKFIQGMELTPEYQHFVWMGYYDDIAKNRLFKKEILDQISENTWAPVGRLVQNLKEDDLISRIMHLDALFFLEGNGLFQADRMTMAASLEARVPLLNINLIEYVNSLPSKIKIRGGKTKWFFRKILKDYLPQAIIDKPKKGFGPPHSAWSREIFADTFDSVFDRTKIGRQGIFEYEEIKRLLGEHNARKADHGRNLWALLSFQLWYDNFIMKQPNAL